VCVCVCARVRACVRACVCVYIFVLAARRPSEVVPLACEGELKNCEAQVDSKHDRRR
jgi:hypothetical protein